MMVLQKNLKRFDLKLKVRLFYLSKIFLTEELSTSQKQAVIKLLENKIEIKRSIDNLRSRSLLNADVN